MQASLLRRPIAVFLMVLLAPAGTLSAEVLLRYRFNPSETLQRRAVQEVQSLTTIEGQAVSSTLVQSLQTSQYVRDVGEDGVASLQHMIDRVTITMTMPEPVNRRFEYDSSARRNDEAPPGYSELMGALVGARFRMQLSPTGRLTQTEIPEPVLQKLQAIPGEAMVGSLASEEGLRQLLTQFSIELPDEPIELGDQWRSEVSSLMPWGRVTTQQIYTYDGPTPDELERINVDYQMEFKSLPGDRRSARLIESHTSGVILFDNQRGEMASMEIVQNVKMELSAGERVYPQEIRQRVRLARE